MSTPPEELPEWEKRWELLADEVAKKPRFCPKYKVVQVGPRGGLYTIKDGKKVYHTGKTLR